MPKFGDIVRVIEAGADLDTGAVGIVKSVVGDLVDVVAHIRGEWRELHGIKTVSADAAADPAAGEHAIHVAVPLDSQPSEPADEPSDDETPAPAGPPPAMAASAPSS